MDKIRCLGCMQEYDDNMDICPVCGAPKKFRQKEPYYLPAGTVLEGKYLIGKAFSSSKFSITYMAYDLPNDKKVVIKEYFPTDLASRMPGQVELNTYDGERAKQFEAGLVAFIEESQNLMQLSDSIDGIANFLDVFIDNSTAYSVVEYIDGIALSEVLKNGALPWNDLVQVMDPLLNSMVVIHKAGIVNYNISPDNIIMTRDKKVKLLSFGGSKLATSGANINLSVITKSGYSPVEMYKEDISFEPSADVYSIAAVMYYAITGVVPANAVERSNSDLLESPLAMGIKLPVNVNNAIMNALNVNRKHRTQNCEDFLAELHSKSEVKRVVEEKKKEYSGKLSKRSIIIIALISVIAIAAIIGIGVTMKTVLNRNVEPETKISEIGSYVGKDLNDETLEEELDSLKESGIKIVYEYEIDENQDKNTKIIRIQKTVPENETKIENIKKLILRVTIPPIQMPNLIGNTKAQARKKLVSLGISEDNIVFKNKKTNDYADGKICAQSVKKNKKITDINKTIVLYVAENYTTTTAPATTRRSGTGTTKKHSGGNTGTRKPSGGGSSGGDSEVVG